MFSNDLIEAYKGYYEDEYDREQQMRDGGRPESEKGLFENWIQKKILGHTAKQRLEVYLEWNGIIGYAGRAYEIAIGQI